VAALPQVGSQDLVRRLRIVWLRLARYRLRRSLFQAETELGWLGWEQVDFFDNEIGAEVKKVQEFENTQASLQNTTAELSGRKAAIDEELAREQALHDQAQAALAADRAPIAAQLQQAEATRRHKLDSVERFGQAIDEIKALEQRLEDHSKSFMHVVNPTMAIRAEAREVSDELARLVGERKLVLADKANAAHEAAGLETVIARLRAELQRIDAAADAARDTLDAAAHRLTGETRLLTREKERSSLRMAHLDREKEEPYRAIGACLADHGIAPLNQPLILEKVVTLRLRQYEIDDTLSDLRAASAAAHPATLIVFYLLLASLLFALSAIAFHFL
jgi:DNA repair exonuclease SbcCD ATPase subunit